MDNNPQQMPKGGIRKTLEEMLNEYEIRGWDSVPLIRQEDAAELMENYAYQELTQIRAERDAYRIALEEIKDRERTAYLGPLDIKMRQDRTVTGFIAADVLDQYPSPNQYPPLIDKLP